MLDNSTFSSIYQPHLTIQTSEESRLNPTKPKFVESGYGQVSETLIQNGFTPMATFGGKTPARYGGWINVNNIDQHSDPNSPVYKYIFQERKRPPQLGDLFGYRIRGWQTYTPEKLKSPDYLEEYNQKRGISHLEEYNQWRAISGAGVCILTGELAGNLFAFDIDWLDDDLTEEARLVIEDVLGGFGDIVMRRGSKGLCAFLRLEDGFYLGKDLDCSAGKIDLLYNGKQSVIPPSVHPTSDKPYVWLTERTLLNTTVDQLPIVTEELWFELMAALEQVVGPISGKERQSAPKQSKDNREFEDSFDCWVATEALKVADDWIKELDLAKLEKINDDFWVAVPSFRSSSTGRPDSQRTQNLHFTPKLIVDRGGSFRHWSLDRLVAKCLGVSNDEAWRWLYQRVPALKLPVLELKPTPVIPPAAKLAQQTIRYNQAAEELDSIVENEVITRTELNKDLNKQINAFVSQYEDAVTSVEKDEIEKEIKSLVDQLPNGIIIKAQTGVGKTRAIKKYMFDFATAMRSDTTAMYFPTNALAHENLETLAPAAVKQTGLYHPPTETFLNEDGEYELYCSHPSLKSALKLDMPVERLCNGGGDHGARCPHFNNCPFRQNNKFLKQSDTHMMASHAVALTPCNGRTGTFDTVVVDEEIFSAAMSGKTVFKRYLLGAKHMLTLPEMDTDEYQDYLNFDYVMADLREACDLSIEDVDDSDDAPLNMKFIEASVININQARGYALKEKYDLQDEAIRLSFASVDQISSKISRLSKIVNVLEELVEAKLNEIKLSGRILIEPETGDIKLYQMASIDQKLLIRGYPIVLDATASNKELYSKQFCYDIKLGKNKFIRVQREFDIIEHTPVSRAEGFKVVQVSNAPSSSTKLGLKHVRAALKADTYTEPKKGERNRDNLLSVIKTLRDAAQDDFMLICNKSYIDWLDAKAERTWGFLSYGALAGTNTHEQDKIGLIVSHKRLPTDVLFRQVGQVTGEYRTDRENTKVKRTQQLTDGSTQLVDGYSFNDETVERWSQWNVQRSFIQGVGRLRPLTDKGFNQTVFVLTPEDTGVIVDEVVNWSDLVSVAKKHQNEQALAELSKITPISSSWRFNQSVGIKQPVVIADKIRGMASAAQSEIIKGTLLDPLLLDSYIGQSQQGTFNKFEVISIEGNQKFEVFFTSEQDLQDYITDHNLPYRIIKTIEWSDDVVALTARDIQLQQGVGGKKAKQLSQSLTTEVPPSHEVIEFKTPVAGIPLQGKWRRAAVRVGVDAVEAIKRCLSIGEVLLREA